MGNSRNFVSTTSGFTHRPRELGPYFKLSGLVFHGTAVHPVNAVDVALCCLAFPFV